MTDVLRPLPPPDGSAVESVSAVPPVTLGITRHGPMLWLDTDQYLGLSLARYGEYSEGEVRLFQQYVQPGMCVLDIGANLGAFTVPLAKLVGPAGGVIAFEPQPFIYYLLCGNLALNACFNAIAERTIVGEKVGVASIRALDYTVDGSFGGFTVKEPGPIPTSVTTIDAFRLSRCDFIKCDVEGMERQVLQGGLRTLRRFRPVLYLEANFDDQRLELCKTLGALGYTVTRHEPPLYEPTNWRGDPVNAFPDTVSRNLLAVPT